MSAARRPSTLSLPSTTNHSRVMSEGLALKVFIMGGSGRGAAPLGLACGVVAKSMILLREEGDGQCCGALKPRSCRTPKRPARAVVRRPGAKKKARSCEPRRGFHHRRRMEEFARGAEGG